GEVAQARPEQRLLGARDAVVVRRRRQLPTARGGGEGRRQHHHAPFSQTTCARNPRPVHGRGRIATAVPATPERLAAPRAPLAAARVSTFVCTVHSVCKLVCTRVRGGLTRA